PCASGVFSRYSSFLPQSKDMWCSLIGISKMSIVCVNECVCSCALRWVGTPSRVSPALCPRFPGIGSRLPMTLCRSPPVNRIMVNFRASSPKFSRIHFTALLSSTVNLPSLITRRNT
ncbi:hypothetical protein PDJAM_G00162130, partial [Pangasius djambal]|nr:hypothetical protein [Pangasius djambal]